MPVYDYLACCCILVEPREKQLGTDFKTTVKTAKLMVEKVENRTEFKLVGYGLLKVTQLTKMGKLLLDMALFKCIDDLAYGSAIRFNENYL